jgi:hypothetical protein
MTKKMKEPTETSNSTDRLADERLLDTGAPMLISFSGGRTSAFMAKFLMEYEPYKNFEKVVCFANTGKEHEATLEFVDRCDREFGLNVVWLEAVVNPEKGKGTSFKIVDFESSSRQGDPFEAVIAKYGIPSKQFPHCTRELKQRPINAYMRDLGLNDWVTAIGIRADESHRINYNNGIWRHTIYPLADLLKVDEAFIREWWSRQSFDLELKDYEGNCDLCWKKSKRKRLTLISENSSVAEWWANMEKEYGQGKYLFDQRDGLSIPDLVELAKRPFSKAIDKHEASKMNMSLFEPTMDLEWDCFCKAS